MKYKTRRAERRMERKMKSFNNDNRMVAKDSAVTDQCLFDPEGNKGNAYMETIHYKKAKEALVEKLDNKISDWHFITYSNSYLREIITVAYHISGKAMPIDPLKAKGVIFSLLEATEQGALNLNASYKMRVISMPLNTMLPYEGCTCPNCCRLDYIGGSNVHDSCMN